MDMNSIILFLAEMNIRNVNENCRHMPPNLQPKGYQHYMIPDEQFLSSAIAC
jgi:hypothetical protein